MVFLEVNSTMALKLDPLSNLEAMISISCASDFLGTGNYHLRFYP